MNKIIEISETQASCLLVLLKELIKEQHSLGCNDITEDDAFHKLSDFERENAKRISDGGLVWNFTAASYLAEVIKDKLQNNAS